MPHRRKHHHPFSIRSTLVLAAFLFSLSGMVTPCFQAHAEPAQAIKVESIVHQATVFPDMARVTRSGKVNLNERGSQTLDLVNLSERLYRESFQVGGKGTAKVRILGASLERVFSTQEVDSRLESLAQELQQRQDQDRTLQDQRDAVMAQMKFVQSLVSTYGKHESQDMATKRLSINDWKQATSFVGDRLNGLAKQLQTLDIQRRDLAKTIAALQTQLRELRSKRGHWTITAHVSLEVLKPGSFTATAQYLMPGASWNMVYDARYQPDKREVELGCYGVLNQRTGDDWDNVTLVLSTARPKLDGTLPELDSRYVDFYYPAPPPAPRAMSRSRSFKKAEMNLAVADEMASGEAMEEDYDDEPSIAQMASAQVETIGFASFTVPKKTSIPSDNQTHKVFLLARSWTVEPHIELVPEQSEAAFLAAKTTNPFDFPLLAGEINLFMDEDFVGRASIPTTQSGEELLLPFGQDPRVKVERKQITKKQYNEGVINKSIRVHYHYSIRISNLYKDRDIQVRLLERIPVSRHKDIQVKLSEKTSQGFTKDKTKPGVLSWSFSLKAKQKTDISIQYDIEYPKGMMIQGAP